MQSFVPKVSTKIELRKEFLDKRENFSVPAVERESERIAEMFFNSFDLTKIKVLHCFLPIAKFNEINTMWIFERIWHEFPRIETVVPRVNFQTNEIENLKFTSETKLTRNQWEIDEPERNEVVETKKVDVILVPLLCFDARGFRVGYGKGFYDKFLANCRPDSLKIGLSYFPPVAEISDIHEFDVRLDFCVTAEKVFETTD